MLFDIVFFGLPLATAICLAAVAMRENDIKFWTCSLSIFAYTAFYFVAGRDILLYLTTGLIVGHSWLSSTS